MEQRDVDNLKFLLSLSPVALKQWYEQAGEDDIQYASELLDNYEHELMLAGVESTDFVHKAVSTLQ